MGWVVALFAITALVMLWLILSRPEAEKDWRDQAEGTHGLRVHVLWHPDCMDAIAGSCQAKALAGCFCRGPGRHPSSRAFCLWVSFTCDPAWKSDPRKRGIWTEPLRLGHLALRN
jgi:hypothetical protein